MSIHSTKVRFPTQRRTNESRTKGNPRVLGEGQLSVPWSTILPLAVVLAYADGFWLVSLRGAVGAIERTQSPFATWLRESTLMLPVFVFAVLGALTLAQRRFGPVLRSSRTVVATALLVVVTGTVAGFVEMAASSAYDFSLQSAQLHLMQSLSHTTVGHLQSQQATFWLQVRAVVYGSAILLATNVVLVGWVVALRGGRLNVSTPRPHAGSSRTATAQVAGEQGSRVEDLRHLLAALLLGSALIHGSVVPEHLTVWGAAGAFFVVLVTGELAVAVALVVRRQHAALFAAVVISIGPLTLWLYSRTIGVPFGQGAGVEPVGLADSMACLLEIGTLIVAVVLLRRRAQLLRRPAASAHVGWLILVAVIAITAIGFAGTGVAGLGLQHFGDHVSGSGHHFAMIFRISDPQR